MYFGEFKNRQDVCEAFNIPEFEGIIVLAVYDCPDYEGHAEVIYYHDGMYYMVHGAHCSCHGLEDQWEPVEMPIDGLRRIIEQGRGLIAQYGGEGLSDALDQIETLTIEGASPDVIQMALKLTFG